MGDQFHNPQRIPQGIMKSSQQRREGFWHLKNSPGARLGPPEVTPASLDGVPDVARSHFHFASMTSGPVQEVSCEKRSDGGWTVIQRRNGKGLDGKPVNFRRSWGDYQRGFGHVGHEHWLGLDYIHALTQQKGKTCQLRVDMINCKGKSGYAFYDAFKIGNESELYRISLGNYVGNVGDAFRGEGHAGSQDGHYFSTIDEDNDDCTVCINRSQAYRSCARDLYGSGWWFSNCGMADLNGDWHPKTQCEGWLSGVNWETWDRINSLIFSELKVKCTLL
ncbi:fibroleukin-like [Tiliqua scincoides]|uniref:fibroleukin-like n=1 Tax=Tiliqua scincoides TaxID=71010 RepID=UPI0034626037